MAKIPSLGRNFLRPKVSVTLKDPKVLRPHCGCGERPKNPCGRTLYEAGLKLKNSHT